MRYERCIFTYIVFRIDNATKYLRSSRSSDLFRIVEIFELLENDESYEKEVVKCCNRKYSYKLLLNFCGSRRENTL